nr:GAD-like domain-containing protein [Providencia sneebia]
MRDLYFSSIIDSLGEATASCYVPPEHIAKWKTILPDNLLNCWINEGWSSYQYGLFSFVNPSLYKDVVLEWLDGTHLIEMDNFRVLVTFIYLVINIDLFVGYYRAMELSKLYLK